LRKQFGDVGIQVTVKLANIELSPEEGKTNYAGGTWHVEGQSNERICASAIYYYDQANITESRLSFQQSTQTDDLEAKPYEQWSWEGLEKIYGIQQRGPSVQNLGSVVTRNNRFIAFPNVLQRCVQPLGLKDPAKTGYRRILALFLVDPYIRVQVISTANVPPQQRDRWYGTPEGRGSFRILISESEFGKGHPCVVDYIYQICISSLLIDYERRYKTMYNIWRQAKTY
jgi:hypothetical protein